MMVSFGGVREVNMVTVLSLCLRSFRITFSCTTVVLLLFSLLFAYVSHHICLALAAAPPHYLTLPISLNSLDLAGVRLMSPHDSQILPKPACRCRWVRADDTTKLRRSSMKTLSFVLFRSSWSVVEPSWGRSGTFVVFGVLLLFWFRSRTMSVFDWCNVYSCNGVKWQL